MAEYLRQRAQGSSQPVPVLHVTTLPIDEANAAGAAADALRGFPARRCGRRRAADCLRQHREPAAVPGRGAAARDRRPAGAGREPGASRSAAPDRKRAVVAPRRRRRRAARLGRRRGLQGCAAAAGRPAAGRRLRDRSAGPVLRAAAVVRDRHPVRHRSRARRVAAGTRARAQGWRRLSTASAAPGSI